VVTTLLYRLAKSIFDSLLSPELGRFGNGKDPIPLEQHIEQAPSANPYGYPKISIVTPSFNNGPYLAKTMDSVLAQPYPNLEYVVMDGGSTDGSVEAIEAVSDRLASWQSRSDNGQAHAINEGFTRCSGEIMAYLNSDDILLRGSLHYVAHYFLEHPEIDAIYGHRILIDEEDREIGRWILPPHTDSILYWRDYIPQETLFWRRTAWQKIGASLDDTMHFTLDWDLVLRLVKSGARIKRVPRFLGAFRIREGQKSTTLHDTYAQEANVIYSKYLGYIPSQATVRMKVLPYLLASRAMELALKLKILKI